MSQAVTTVNGCAAKCDTNPMNRKVPGWIVIKVGFDLNEHRKTAKDSTESVSQETNYSFNNSTF